MLSTSMVQPYYNFTIGNSNKGHKYVHGIEQQTNKLLDLFLWDLLTKKNNNTNVADWI